MSILSTEEQKLTEKLIKNEAKQIRLRTLGLQSKFIRNFFRKNMYDISYACHYNEYLWPVKSGEEALIAKLEEELSTNSIKKQKHILNAWILLSCYKPLHDHPLVEKVLTFAEELNCPVFSKWVQTLILDFRTEESIKNDLKTFGKISESVSCQVKDQYETNPYPRWTAPPPLSEIGERDERKQDILIAGCGTGLQVVNFARKYPNASITAIDLSKSSLAYAKRKMQELDIKNVTFMCGDILDVDKLKQKYDLIVSTGVLHHMEDPQKGWEALVSVLKATGKMRISLYSHTGRALVRQAQEELIQEPEGDFSPEKVRALRKHIMSLPETSPFKRFLLYSDFYSLSAMRDLFFHVQEHQFTLPKIHKLLDQLGLKFEKFQKNNDLISDFYKNHPAEEDQKNLDLWHAYEQEHPLVFIGMYNLTCSRK